MRKEIVIAILMGLTVGLVIVFGIYRTRAALAPKDQTTKLEEVTSPSPSAETLSNLVVHSPIDESIQDNEEVTVAGSTSPNSFVVIIVNEDDFVTTADESGNFSISATLETGGNIIIINSIDEDGHVTTEERSVVYSTKPLLEEASESEEETTDAE